ncbi:MAG: putative ribosome biogenesis GTPase RsgA [Melioribacteraceae bacterium]|nr:MAG: putative ribosome biogenesis GTPase RsgA [Melioribacteraceae bacterium]
MKNGRVYKVESKDIYVIDDEGSEYRCSIRGRLKKSFNLKKDKLYNLDIAIVGDNVKFNENNDGSGVIEDVENRHNYISRKSPRIKGAGVRGERLEQVIAANVDNLFIITSVYDPVFNNKLLDRLIVTGESSHIDINIIINKVDLDEENLIEPWGALYENLGYSVILVSAETGEGIEEIREHLAESTSIFWGQSGVGKSSILNSLYPELEFRVGDISDLHRKGKHTTVTAVMAEPEEGVRIIDTPGIREIEPFGIKKEDLGHYFVEFGDFLNQCKFNTCTHFHEPGCAVRDAVEDEEISVERYESYLNMLETIEDDINF